MRRQWMATIRTHQQEDSATRRKSLTLSCAMKTSQSTQRVAILSFKGPKLKMKMRILRRRPNIRLETNTGHYPRLLQTDLSFKTCMALAKLIWLPIERTRLALLNVSCSCMKKLSMYNFRTIWTRCSRQPCSLSFSLARMSCRITYSPRTSKLQISGRK